MQASAREAGLPRQDRGTRADLLLVERGLASSRAEARAAILSGGVRANGLTVAKPSQLVSAEAEFSYVRAHRYVSRGGIKLAAALDGFAFSPADKICLDLGASTGGFTEVLLERGARRVYAVEVGHGQLARSLREDGRVIALERVNARELGATQIPEPVEFIVADLSFISLKLALPAPFALAKPRASLVALFKPQFEVGRRNIGKRGIVRNPEVRQRALDDFVEWLSSSQGWTVTGTAPSPILGGDGNEEFLIAARNERGH